MEVRGDKKGNKVIDREVNHRCSEEVLGFRGTCLKQGCIPQGPHKGSVS